jgi:hypothetical protein
MIAATVELYPRLRVGSSKGIDMTLPEHILLKRRLQPPDDKIRQARRCNARGPDDTLHTDTPREDGWVGHFMDRLAGLIRHIGGKK